MKFLTQYHKVPLLALFFSAIVSAVWIEIGNSGEDRKEELKKNAFTEGAKARGDAIYELENTADELKKEISKIEDSLATVIDRSQELASEMPGLNVKIRNTLISIGSLREKVDEIHSDAVARFEELGNEKADKQDLQLLEKNVESLLKVKAQVASDLKETELLIDETQIHLGELFSDFERVDEYSKNLGVKVVKLGRTTIDIQNVTGDLKTVLQIEAAQTHNMRNLVSRLWVLIAAALVFLMQAGFKCLEVGMVRKLSAESVGLKNLLDWLVASLAYYLIGFHIMFSRDLAFGEGWVWFIPTPENLLEDSNPLATDSFSTEGGRREEFLKGYEGSLFSGLGFEFFLFQLAFAGTAATIVSGAAAGRISKGLYLFLSFLVTAILYPLFGRIAWGATYFGEDKFLLGFPSLVSEQFSDFAGGCVVHLLGASVALAAILHIGPRRNQANIQERISSKNLNKFLPNNLTVASIGSILLWFGWWGFNGGSLLKLDFSVAEVILFTNSAAAAGGLAACFFEVFWRHVRAFFERRSARSRKAFDESSGDWDGPPVSVQFEKRANQAEMRLSGQIKPRNLYQKVIGGVLGGLVAITPCAWVEGSVEGSNCMSFGFSVVVGLVAGILHNISYAIFCEFWEIDDDAGRLDKFFRRAVNYLDDPVGAIPVHGVCAIWGAICVAIVSEKIGVFDQVSGIVVAFIIGFFPTMIVLGVIKFVFGAALRDDPVEVSHLERLDLRYGIPEVSENDSESKLDGVEFSIKTGFLGWTDPTTIPEFLKKKPFYFKVLDWIELRKTPDTRQEWYNYYLNHISKRVKGLKVDNCELRYSETASIIVVFVRKFTNRKGLNG